MRIYLDHNATAPLDDEARRAALAALDEPGNPSSVHGEGRRARDVVEEARRRVAAIFGGEPDEVVFTSGGTEADAVGIVGLALAARRAGRPARVVTTAVEHPAVLGAAKGLGEIGFAVVVVGADRDGRVRMEELAEACRDGGAVLALAAVNHELGTVQDVAAASAIARAAGMAVHVDAVQAAGRMRLEPVAAAADAVAISGHKLGAPKGIGALWVRRGVDVASAFAGGHQERGRRAGTENVVGIAGLGAVAGRTTDTRVLAERLEVGLVAMGARINGAGARRIGNTVNAAWDGVRGESVVIALDLAGVAVSTGAACTSGSIQPSAVLLAIGQTPEQAREAVRFSLGVGNTEDEIERVLSLLPVIVSRARRAALRSQRRR